MLCLLLAAVLVAAFVRPGRADVDATRSSVDDRGRGLLEEPSSNSATVPGPTINRVRRGTNRAVHAGLAQLRRGGVDEKVQAALAALRTLSPPALRDLAADDGFFCAAEPAVVLLLI